MYDYILMIIYIRVKFQHVLKYSSKYPVPINQQLKHIVYNRLSLLTHMHIQMRSNIQISSFLRFTKVINEIFVMHIILI